jgi:hypothetical protein
MRRLVLKILLVFVGLGAIGLTWIFGGRQIALVVDRLGTAEIARVPITALSYDRGMFRLENERLSTTGPDDRPIPLSIAPNANNQLILLLSGKSFPLGDLVPASSQEAAATLTVQPDKDDNAVLVTRRSFLSWPTPFDFNFMTGHAPSWKRHRYHQVIWSKRAGPRLEMLWRHDQYFYPAEGWTEGSMTHEGTTGLIRATIQP